MNNYSFITMSENNTISIDSVIENLISIHPLLSKTFTRSIRHKTNLNPGSLYVLDVLMHYEKLSMSEIGFKLAMPKPHVTNQVDKLIVENMVERFFDPADRRIINISITPKGIEDFNDIKQSISEEMRHKLELLDNETLEKLSVASLQVKEILMTIDMDRTKTSGTYCKSE